VLRYFDQIEVANISTKIFKIIYKRVRFSHIGNLLEYHNIMKFLKGELHPIEYGVVHDKLYKPSTFFLRLCFINYYLPFKKDSIKLCSKNFIWNMEWLKTNLMILKYLIYDAYVKHIVSKKLWAKSDKCKFMRYPKKLLDIIYIIMLSKNVCLKTYYLYKKRICYWKK
jgi:hypothetical protein